MRESLTMLGAIAASWMMTTDMAEARCDLTDPAAGPAVGATLQARRAVMPATPTPTPTPVAHPPLSPASVTRDAASHVAPRNAFPPARLGEAIPDNALMRKRRIL